MRKGSLLPVCPAPTSCAQGPWTCKYAELWEEIQVLVTQYLPRMPCHSALATWIDWVWKVPQCSPHVSLRSSPHTNSYLHLRTYTDFMQTCWRPAFKKACGWGYACSFGEQACHQLWVWKQNSVLHPQSPETQTFTLCSRSPERELLEPLASIPSLVHNQKIFPFMPYRASLSDTHRGHLASCLLTSPWTLGNEKTQEEYHSELKHENSNYIFGVSPKSLQRKSLLTSLDRLSSTCTTTSARLWSTASKRRGNLKFCLLHMHQPTKLNLCRQSIHLLDSVLISWEPTMC